MIHVLKANRSYEPFSEHKVMDSIKRARVPHSMRGEVLTHVKQRLYQGISTGEIYQLIKEYLEHSAKPYVEARYSLKEAIMELGPSGYPFEDFICKLMESDGYTTQVRQVLNGKCVMHEIDVIAEKDGKRVMIEAKFHNSPGTRSEIQTALYTHARFEDVKVKNNINEAWLVTNTKTTIDANTYAECCGMRVMSWDYPAGHSLRELIERSGLHPITMLTTLTQSQKATLLDNHVVLCKDIKQNPQVLERLYLSRIETEKIFAELTALHSDS